MMESPSPSPAPEFKQASCTLSTTPPYKLPLFSLPYSKPVLPADGITPPPTTVAAAIPFLWEEAPGIPRSISDDPPPKSKAVRSLDLPPRLAASPFNNIRIQVIPSPTTVLAGPYEDNSRSVVLGSPEKVVVVSSKGSSNKAGNMRRMPLRKLMRKERSPAKVKFSSWRWDSHSFIRDSSREDRSSSTSPSSSVKLCSWRWDSFRDMSGDGGGSLDSGGNKIEKVARRNSFTFGIGNANTSGFLANVYGSLKQAMPWRSRR